MKDNSWHDNFELLLKEIKSSMNGQVIGNLLKETPTGKFANAWRSALDKSGLKEEESSTGFNLAMAVKDEDEILSMKKTALLSSKAMKKFARRMWGIIDEDNDKVKHSQLAGEIESNIDEPSKMGSSNLDESACESVVTSVQSGSGCKLSRNEALDKEEEILSYDNIFSSPRFPANVGLSSDIPFTGDSSSELASKDTEIFCERASKRLFSRDTRSFGTVDFIFVVFREALRF